MSSRTSSMVFVPEKDFAPIILVGKLPMGIAAYPTFAGIQWPIWLRPLKRIRTRSMWPCQARPRGSFSNSSKRRPAGPLFAVPYRKGSATAMTDVLGGQVPLIIDTVTALRSQIADGKLKALWQSAH